jgi:hypothetical protein
MNIQQYRYDQVREFQTKLKKNHIDEYTTKIKINTKGALPVLT